jgi:hypothetical protein
MDKPQAFIEDELSRAPALLARVLDATLDELREDLMSPGRRYDESKGRLIEAVVADRPPFEKRFLEALREKVLPGSAPAEAKRNTLDFASSELMLIDDDQVQDGIVVARAFELVEQRAEWELRDLQSLTSALVGGKVSKDTNPFTPQNYAYALGQAVKVLRVPASDQHALIQACVSALSRELKQAYSAAAKRLREAGVSPASYQATQVVTPQSAAGAASSASPQAAPFPGGVGGPGMAPGGAAPWGASFPGGVGAPGMAPGGAAPWGASFPGGVGAPGMAPGGGGMGVAPAAVAGAVPLVAVGAAPFGVAGAGHPAAFGAVPLAVGSVPGAMLGAGAAPLLGAPAGQLAGGLPAGSGGASYVAAGGGGMLGGGPVQSAAHSHTLRVEAAAHMADLFAAMQRDHDVPVAGRAALGDLARAATQLAQRDAAVLADARHALWQLVNRFADATSLYPGDDAQAVDPRLAELIEYWGEQVIPTLEAEGADSLTCIKLLSGLELVVGRVRQQQLDQAREAMEKIERVERETAGMARATRFIDARLTGLVVPGTVRLFLKGPWSLALSRLMDSRGTQSAATRQAQATVDALLETLTPLASSSARAARVRLAGTVRSQLKAGLSYAEVSNADAEAFLSKLSQMQALVLTAKPGASDLNDVAVRPMSADELRADASLAEDHSPETTASAASTTMPVIDANALATVPAELMQLEPSGTARRLTNMAVGDACRVFVGGGFQPMQLLWISPQHRYWLFAGPQPGVVTSLAKLALEQLDAAGLMKPLHPMSLLDRCLARVSGVVDTHF